MTSYYFKAIVLCIFLGVNLCYSQTPGLWETELAVNTKINNRWSLNLGTSNRNTFSNDLGNTPLQLKTNHLQFEINTAYEVGFYSKLGAGVMYRFNTIANKNAENELRITEQFSLAKYYNALRMVHRFKWDQRIKTSETVHRFRYRFSTDFPLQGLQLDPQEFYLILSTETLLNAGASIKPAWDQRVVTALGYQLSKPIKLQFDVEYRVEDFVNPGSRWFLIT